MTILLKEKKLGFAERDGFGFTGFHPILVIPSGTYTLKPNAAGDVEDISTLIGAATHWEACKVSDGDTSYVAEIYSQTTRDLYNLESLPGEIGVISNIVVYITVRRTAAATCAVSVRIKTGGAEFYGSAIYLTGTAYNNFTQTWLTNPLTGVAWTVADIKALQAGVIMTGNNYLQNEVRCTRVAVNVTVA